MSAERPEQVGGGTGQGSHARRLFEYTVIRVVPSVERGEAINAGIVLFCRQRRFLHALVNLDAHALQTVAPTFEAQTVRPYLDAIPRIAAGEADAGPIAKLPMAERFRWLAARSSTVVQPSDVHTGLTQDPAETLDHLFRTLVLGRDAGREPQRRIEIVDYRPEWPHEFSAIARRVREALGDAAVRIDHIGSTAVPGLPAKDVIDIQVTVAGFDPEPAPALASAGLVALPRITGDHEPPGVTLSPEQLEKRLFQAGPRERRANVHVRVEGRFNQRYALLCRDYLRADRAAAGAYGRVKVQVARLFPYDAEAYYDVKDPVFDILMAGAEGWAASTGWHPGRPDA